MFALYTHLPCITALHVLIISGEEALLKTENKHKYSFFFFCVAPSYCKATKAKHAKIQPLNVLWHVWELKQTILIIMPLILQN